MQAVFRGAKLDAKAWFGNLILVKLVGDLVEKYGRY